MAQLQIALYRTFSVTRDGSEVPPPPTRRARALLTFLLLSPAPTVSRRAIAALFWPEIDEERAAAAIRQNLYLIRRWLQEHLGNSELLTTRDAAINLNRSAFHIDILMLETALRAQQEHQHRNPASCSICLQKLQHALGHFRLLDPQREVYPEDGFEQWLDQRTALLPGSFGQACSQVITASLRRNHLIRAEQLARDWIIVDPYAETAHRTLALCLERSGRRVAALQHLHQFADLLKQELSTEPEAETLRLLARLTANEEAVYRPTWYQPPAPAAALIGRENELAALLKLFADPHVRLVTVSGIGGIGKTSLALLAAQQIAAECEHGALFVPLAGITDLDQAAVAVAAAAGITLSGHTRIIEQIVDAFAELNLLLILDNLEQLSDARRLLDAFLLTAPQVIILTTSRRPVDHRRQHALHLGGLAWTATHTVPDPAASYTSGTAAAVTAADISLPPTDAALPPAVQLFLQTAAHHVSDPDALDRAAVAAVCRMVGGNPLALGLLAHQLQYVDFQQLHRALEHDEAGSVTVKPGSDAYLHTMNHIIRDSLAAVGPTTVNLISVACLFSDTFSAATLFAVINLPPATADDSLRQARSAGLIESAAVDTYRLHPLIRFAGPTVEHEARQRFLRFHLNLIDSPRLDFVNAEARRWNSSQRPVLRDSIRAVELAAQHGEYERLQRVIFRLATLALIQGQQLSMIAAFQRTAAQLDDQPGPAAASRRRLAAGALWLRLTTLDSAAVLVESAVLLADPALNQASLDGLLVCHCRCSALLFTGSLAEAAVALAGPDAARNSPPCELLSGAPVSLVHSDSLHGRLALARGDYAAAITLLRQAADRCGTAGDQRGQLACLNDLAQAQYRAGSAQMALSTIEEAKARACHAGDLSSLVVILSNCGSLRLELGIDIDRAEQELLEALELSRQLGFRHYRRSPLRGIIKLRHHHRDYRSLLAPCLEFIRLELALGMRPIGLRVVTLLAETLLPDRPLLAADLLDLVSHHRLADPEVQARCSQLRNDIPSATRRTVPPHDPDTELGYLIDLIASSSTKLQ